MYNQSCLLISDDQKETQIITGSKLQAVCNVFLHMADTRLIRLSPVQTPTGMQFIGKTGEVCAEAAFSNTANWDTLTISKYVRDKSIRLLATGTVELDKPIICSINDTGKDSEYFQMTSGGAYSSNFNCFYSPNNDTAIVFDAGSTFLNIAPDMAHYEVSDTNTIEIKILRNHYRTIANPYYKPMDKERFPRPPIGWLSWYCYFGNFDEEKTLKTLDFADKNFKRFGFQYVQLENWQKHSWKLPVEKFHHKLEWDEEKFPHGMKYISDKIKERGLIPGLWVVPLGTGEEEQFKTHPEMYLRDESGNPLGNWSGDYALDPTHPDSLKSIYNTMHVITNDWGYDYVKVDGLELGGAGYADEYYTNESIASRFSNPMDEPLRKIGNIIREAIGDQIFFTSCAGSWKRAGKIVGIANAARVGSDVLWEGNDPIWEGVVVTARAIQKAHYVHNIFWYNDPDVLAMRSPLTTEHARLLTTMYGLSGQLLFLGDIIYELPEEKVDMLKRIMPVENVYPGHIPLDDPEKTPAETGLPWSTDDLKDTWILHIKKPFEDWCVVALINFDETQTKTLILNASSAGLDSDSTYLLYDYWHDKFLGSMQGEKAFDLACQSCLLLAVREEQSNPQILSINRHVTQDSISLIDVNWDNDSDTLHGISDVVGDDEYRITLHIPEEYSFDSVQCDIGSIDYTIINPKVAKITINCSENTRIIWSVRFA